MSDGSTRQEKSEKTEFHDRKQNFYQTINLNFTFKIFTKNLII